MATNFKNTPRANIYSCPPDEGCAQERLHYIVVQVSRYRHVVAEYDGRTNGVLSFFPVSDPMRYIDAVDRANELTATRLRD
jgi:hypothetical protein